MESSLNARPRAIAKNAASNYLTLALGAVLGFVVTPILLRSLGTTAFGVWSLVLGAVGYLSLLEAGLGPASTNRVAATESEGPEALSRVLSTSLTLSTCVGAGATLIAVALAAVFPLLFHVPATLVTAARVAVVLVGLGQACGALVLVYTAALLGTGRQYVVNLNGFLVSALTSVAQATALLLGGGLEALATIQLVGGLLTFLVFRRRVRRALAGVPITRGRFDRPTARQLLGLGWRNSVYSVTSVLAFGSDVVLVGILLGTPAVAGYAIALRVYVFMQQATTGVLGAIGPAQAHAAHNSTSERRFQLYCISTYITLGLALYAAATVGLFGSSLLGIWLGRVPNGAVSVLTVLCAVLVVQAPGINAAQLLLSSERASELMRITTTSAMVNITASIVLTLAVGRIGPALGSLVAVTLIDAVYMPRRICGLLGQPYPALVRRVFAPLCWPSVGLVCVLAAGYAVVPRGPWVLATAALGAVVFFGALWFLPTGRDIRSLVRGNELAPA
jgi:O-antigen/teichoic acid export membrane protein